MKNEKAKIITITSVKGGTGKTETILNIAGLLSQRNLKTIIVDLDLHSGVIAPILNVKADADFYDLANDISNNHFNQIEDYIVRLIAATRETNAFEKEYVKYIEYGASPRATLALYRCAKVSALAEGRVFVIPDDIKAVIYDVLRHRIVPSYEADSEEKTADDIISMVLKEVKVP